MRKLLFAIPTILLLSYSAHAKLSVRVVVEGIKDKAISDELQQAIEAKLNSTDRYMVDNSDAHDLSLDVDCISGHTEGGYQNALFCSSDVFYLPYRNRALQRDLYECGYMTVAAPHGTEFIASQIVNKLINGTTDAKLAEERARLLAEVQVFCTEHPTACKPSPRGQ